MRIISGTFKGRKLVAPRNLRIRPTTDRVRESIFNILGAGVSGRCVLDLFAGTGAMGLEALSRGAVSALFIDRSREALNLIRRNLAALDLQGRTRVLKWDIGRNLACLAQSPGQFDLAFLDPPYGRQLVMAALVHLKHSGSLTDNARLVIEHSPGETITPAEAGFGLEDQRRYGKTVVSFLSNEP